jgi:hypothetical protein
MGGTLAQKVEAYGYSVRLEVYEMGTRITVTLKGSVGLDDADLLLAELENQTRLDWHREDRPDDKHLVGGFLEILLVAVTSKSVEMAYENAFEKVRELQLREKVREIIERWRETHLDPPDASIETTPVEGSDEAESSAAAEPES